MKTSACLAAGLAAVFLGVTACGSTVAGVAASGGSSGTDGSSGGSAGTAGTGGGSPSTGGTSAGGSGGVGGAAGSPGSGGSAGAGGSTPSLTCSPVGPSLEVLSSAVVTDEVDQVAIAAGEEVHIAVAIGADLIVQSVTSDAPVELLNRETYTSPAGVVRLLAARVGSGTNDELHAYAIEGSQIIDLAFTVNSNGVTGAPTKTDIPTPATCLNGETRSLALSFEGTDVDYAVTCVNAAGTAVELFVSDDITTPFLTGPVDDEEFEVERYVKNGGVHLVATESEVFFHGSTVADLGTPHTLSLTTAGPTFFQNLFRGPADSGAIVVAFGASAPFPSPFPVDLRIGQYAANEYANLEMESPPEMALIETWDTSNQSDLTSFNKGSVGQSSIVMAGTTLQENAVVFSYFDRMGTPLMLGQEVFVGAAGDLVDEIDGIQVDTTRVLIVWDLLSGGVRTVNGQLFTCL